MELMESLEKYHYIINHHAQKTYGKIPEYVRNCISVEDLEQEGYLAFIQACRNFDESYNVKFETFLTQYLINAFSRYLVRVHRKKNLPLSIVSWEEMTSEGPTDRFKDSFPMCQDRQFEQIEFNSSLEQVSSLVSEPAKQLISLIQSGDYVTLNNREITEVLGIGCWKLRVVSRQVLKAVYAKPLLDGWRLTQ